MIVQSNAWQPNPTSDLAIRLNHFRGNVGDHLKPQLLPGSELVVVSACFAIYARAEPRECLDPIGRMRFLIGEPRFVRALDPGGSGTEEP